MKKVELVREEVLQGKGQARLRYVTYRFENGNEDTYAVFDRRASMQMSAGVLPLDEVGNVYLVEEFLPGMGKFGLSLPRGGIDMGETAEAAAHRELKEEAGLACEVLEPLWAGNVLPNMSSWHVTLFVGRGVREVVREGGDEAGGMRTIKMPLVEAVAAVRRGEVEGALTGLALMMLASRF